MKVECIGGSADGRKVHVSELRQGEAPESYGALSEADIYVLHDGYLWYAPMLMRLEVLNYETWQVNGEV